ncbi:MAG: shikimate kinase [Acholeplasmataceae bacterium]|nr:shikimate kinase [Acholeplasmataceae bacterium]
MRIYLIGMPGTGKTTVGKALALALRAPFYDLDALVEEDALMFIEDIFEHHGEETFRKLETEQLKLLKDPRAVVSCGGGIVTVRENKDVMDGLTIYLDTDIDIIRERLSQDYERPLLKQKSLDQLYDERFLQYQHFADLIVDNNGSAEKTVNAILLHLNKGKTV